MLNALPIDKLFLTRFYKVKRDEVYPVSFFILEKCLKIETYFLINTTIFYIANICSFATFLIALRLETSQL